MVSRTRWGANDVSTNDYRIIFRYTAEALRWRLGVQSGQLLLAYSPGHSCWPRDSTTGLYLQDGEERARETFLCRYAGDDVTDIIGHDDYSIGNGGTEAASKTNLVATIRQIALVSKIANERGKACGLFESMGSDNTIDPYFPWLYRAMKGEACRFSFANTCQLPNDGTVCEDTWKRGYLDRPEILTVGHGQSPAFSGFSTILR